MFFQVKFDFIIIQLFFIIILFCINYVTTIFSLIILCLCFLIAAIYTLFKANLILFAIILIFVEIHVIYILACLIFSEMHYETSSQQVVKQSYNLMIIKMVFFSVGTLILFLVNSLFFKKFSIKQNTLLFLLSTDLFTNYNVLQNTTFFSIFFLLNQAFLITFSFEFFILNLLMFFVVILYTTINTFLKKNELNLFFNALKNDKKFMFFNDLFIRVQNQYEQLLKTLAQRTMINIQNIFFKKKRSSNRNKI